MSAFSFFVTKWLASRSHVCVIDAIDGLKQVRPAMAILGLGESVVLQVRVVESGLVWMFSVIENGWSVIGDATEDR